MTPTSEVLRPAAEPDTKSFGAFMLAPPSFGGALGATVFWWFSLTPTLLPRSWLSQAAVTGISVAIGYAIGTGIQALVGWLWRRTRWSAPSDTVRRSAWWVLVVLAAVALIAGILVWPIWQNESRDLVELPHASLVAVLPMVLTAGAVFVFLWMLGRLIGFMAARVDRFIGRFVPVWASRTITLVFLIGIGLGLLAGGGEAFSSWANARFGAADTGTEEGVARPTASTVSGSSESGASWDTLGLQGRTFVAQASSEEELRSFAGDDVEVLDPIRVYAGIRTANDAESRADLVVSELHRTGAFDRAVLVVVTTTGTGWVDPDAAKAIEHMYNGDTAIAGMQYSYFPSWISFLVDGEKAAEAGLAINQAVSDAWEALPDGDRPRLILFGESLGSLGSEDAFAGANLTTSLANVTGRSTGVLWVGPTYANPIWEQLVRDRSDGSPIWRAEHGEGAIVRVGNAPEDLDVNDQTWGPTRVAYFHHPSDPVGYWNWGILYDPPEWTQDPIGYDVSPRTGWFPIVTFNQVVADLIAGFSAPTGYGHNYAVDLITGWAAVAAPEGWTDADTARLEEHLHPGE